MINFFNVITNYERGLPLYLTGLGYDWNQESINRQAGYPYLQWIQCSQGKGIFIQNNLETEICPGKGILLHPDVPHEYYGITDPFITHWVSIGGYMSHNMYQNSPLQNSGIYTISNPDYFIKKFRKLITIEKCHTSNQSLELSKELYKLLVDLLTYAKMDEPFNINEQLEKLSPIIKYIALHYNEVITLKELACFLNITPEHLCTIFKNATGLRVFEYINSVRIKNSKELLITKPDLEIKEVAHKCGYEDSSYFSSVFKKHENVTPLQFRKAHGYH